MEPKITDEELNLLNALYWWQMTGNWPGRIKAIKMLRYHNKVYFPADDKKALEAFTDNLNGLNWRYTVHTLDNIKYRAIDVESMLYFIKSFILGYKDIFEYYKESGAIVKACYRIPCNSAIDIILVMGADKSIITIYLNSKADIHYTLKKDLYIQEAL
jgi:hypothetical protein